MFYKKSPPIYSPNQNKNILVKTLPWILKFTYYSERVKKCSGKSMNMYVHKHGFYEHVFQLCTLHCITKELKVMPKVEKFVGLGALQAVFVQIYSSNTLHMFSGRT